MKEALIPHPGILNRHPGEGRDLRPESHGASPRDEKRRGDAREHGFTLVELMVVIVILGLLATVVVINVLPATDRANTTKAQADISTLEQGVEMYRLNRATYPPSGELQLLLSEKLVKRLPDDPWGRPYVYINPGRDGRDFDIYSLGADGREGGEDDDADIGTWNG